MTGEEGDTAQPVTLVDLIDGLIEPIEPPPIPLMPQTWGWAALAMLVVAGGVWLMLRWRARQRANAYRRAALADLAGADTAAQVARILRRTALAAYPRSAVAGLTGAAWLDFLARTGGAAFPAAAGDELRSAPYRAETAPPSDALRTAAARWIEGHDAALPEPKAREAVA
jgi:hypothetical protein